MPRWSFTEHPASVGETYLQHLVTASGFAARLIAAGGACLVHAVFPFLFVKTGSGAIQELHRRMVTHRRHEPAGAADTVSASR
jgi:uncharacterized protein DUF6356